MIPRALLRTVFLSLSLAAPLGCARATTPGAPSSVVAPDVLLRGEASEEKLDAIVGKRPLTVLLFFTAECPVQKAHDPRVREIVATYEPKGVTFAAIGSEAGADIAHERDEVKARALGMPLYEDRGGALADALGVEYSTHVVLIDARRRVLYSGGVDADRTHMKTSSARYLTSAIDDALAGRPVQTPRTEPLGCPIRKH